MYLIQQNITDVEHYYTIEYLHQQQAVAQMLLRHGTAHAQHQTYDGAVGAGLVVRPHLEQPVLVALAGEGGVAHQPSGRVECRQSVSRTGKHLEQLRDGVDEVHNLRQQQYQQRLGEVSVYADHSKGHSGEVAEGVAHKHLGGEPVVAEQSQGHAYKGQDHNDREQLVEGGFARVEVVQLEEQYAARDHI